MALSARQRDRLASLPVRPLSGAFFRQTDPERQPLDVLPLARRDARWHRAGDPAPAYAASSDVAAMLELPRHIVPEPGKPPVLPLRRLSTLHLKGLQVVDLFNALALEHLDLTSDELTAGEAESPQAELCREIASDVRRRPDAEGILAPSSALRGAQLVCIFPSGFDKVLVGDQMLVELAVVRKEPAPPNRPSP